MKADFPETERRTATVLFTAGPLVYLASIALAVVSPYVFLAFQGALALYYALTPYRAVSAGEILRLNESLVTRHEVPALSGCVQR